MKELDEKEKEQLQYSLSGFIKEQRDRFHITEGAIIGYLVAGLMGYIYEMGYTEGFNSP